MEYNHRDTFNLCITTHWKNIQLEKCWQYSSILVGPNWTDLGVQFLSVRLSVEWLDGYINDRRLSSVVRRPSIFSSLKNFSSYTFISIVNKLGHDVSPRLRPWVILVLNWSKRSPKITLQWLLFGSKYSGHLSEMVFWCFMGQLRSKIKTYSPKMYRKKLIKL
jgi:hypothetical protein